MGSDFMEDDNDVEMEFGEIRLIPEGEYIAEYISHETVEVNFGKNAYKVKIACKVISENESNGVHINIWRNIGGIKKRTIMLSSFLKITGELLLIKGADARLDKVSFKWLKDKKLRLRVKTVKTDRYKVQRHEALHYSVVESILGVYEEEIPF